MEWIQSLLDHSSLPIITAFLLGLLTAISPCPLATNITAIGYISKQLDLRGRIFWNGLLYTLGRTVAYAGLGCILIPLLREGASIYAIQKRIGQYGEIFIAPALILIGIFMLWGHKLRLPKFGLHFRSESLGQRGSLGALLLGVLFALAFCPSSGVLYFGMLIPMSAAEVGGYWLPVVYALGTGLPVVVVAWILAYSVVGLGTFYRRMQGVQKWMNRVIACLFMAAGLYYAWMLWL